MSRGNGMGTSMVRQTSFSGGQVDQVNWQRTDLPGYLQSAQLLQNMEVSITQILKKRRGTGRLKNVTAQTIPQSQMFEFRDINGAYYLILASNEVFYIFDDTWTLIQTLVTPYIADDLAAIDFTLSSDVLILSHPNYPAARVYISNYGTMPPTFAYEALVIYPQPAYDFGNINYNNFAVTFSVSGNIGTFTFTGLSSDPGFTTAWVGGQIIGIGTSADVPVGYGIITAITQWSGGTGPIFTILIQSPFGMPYGIQGSQYAIRQPVFTEALGYPARVLFYQNRLWFGATYSLPQTIFGSALNEPVNFDVGVGLDSDAIIYTIGKSDSGIIVNLNGGKQLEIFTENYEFVCPQDQNISLTPSTLSIRQQSAYGSSSLIKPITYLNDTYYVSKAGQAIMSFHFEGIGLAYTSRNISLASMELVKNPVNRAIQRGTSSSQDNFIYFLNSDASITSLQFDTAYGLGALTPIVFNSVEQSEEVRNTVHVVDILTLNNQIIFLKYYAVSEEYELEMFTDAIWMDGWFATTMGADGVLTGLDDYDGYIIDVYAPFNNGDYGTYLVNAGTVTVINPPPEGTEVYVGLPFDVLIHTMYVYAGASFTDATKRITKIYVDYYNSLNFYVQGSLVPFQTFANVQAGNPLVPLSGQFVIGAADGWLLNQIIVITQTAPFPLTIQSISYQIAACLI